MQYEHKCKRCNDIFYSKVKTSIYCSRYCKDEDGIKLRKFTCQCCGQEIIRTGKQWQGKAPKYCSSTCSIAAMNKGGDYRICQVCGARKYYNPYYNKRVKNHSVYVCKSCRHNGNAHKKEKMPKVKHQRNTCGNGKYKGLTRAKGTSNPSLTYISYNRMLERCYDSKSPSYKFYGAKGVVVCERWKDSYQNFINDMGERLTKEMTLDRINPYGNYEPDNCRWADRKTQSTNKRKII